MRILIVEDEPIHARYLAHTLKEIPATKDAVVQTQRTLTAAECHLQEFPVDLLFLDLSVYGGDGFDLLRAFAGAEFATIVVSAHPDRAIEAFDCGVVDFIAKPLTKARLQTAIDRFTTRRHETRHNLQFFSIQNDGVLETVRLAAVSHFEAADKKTILYLEDGSHRVSTRKIGRIEGVLPPRFQRVHRSFIVDTERIEALETAPGGRYALRLRGGTRMPVSRRVYQSLKEKLFGGE